MTKNVLRLNDLRSETDLIDKHSGFDLIFLNDFTLEANIGVYKHEREGTQPLRINVVAKVKNPKNINDAKEGPYVYHHSDGDREEGTYKDGVKQGP